MEVTGYRDERAGSSLSWLCSVLSLALLAWTGWRFFNPWVAAAALLLAVCCVPDLVLARRAWQDSSMELAGMAIACLACEALTRVNRLPWLVALSAACGYSLLIKDSSPAVFAFWLAWVAGVLVVNEKNWRDAMRLVALSAAATALAVMFLLALAGGFRPLLDVFVRTAAAMAGNAYAVEYQSGSWIRFIGTFFQLSPVAMNLFVLGALASVLPCEGKPGRPVLIGLAAFPLFLLGSSLVVPYSQNIRYLSPVYGPVYLIAAYGLWRAMELARSAMNATAFRFASAFVFAALIASAVEDWREFDRLFVVNEIADLSVKMVVDSSAQ
jgi:hypothetical protein